MFLQTSTVRLQVPDFNYDDPGSWDKYQSRMKTNLFSLSRETDPLKIDREVENWLNVARNGTYSQCMSMYSVVAYFYPNRIHDSYFKSRIEYFYKTLVKVITNKFNEEDKKKQAKTTVTPTSTPKTEVKAPKAKTTATPEDDKEFETEFPTFSDGGFPDSDSDVFDKLLKEENKVPGEADNKE